ncbi:MAG: putative toxin-antitoxin system toxin component, PIN family [Fibrobacteres bacterium]|nr:putative toxin-antitoxin system toxin component, PIN family [Fibrobacterota bacterium]
MLVVLDTNVLFQSLYSSEGASHFILGLIRHQKIKLALSLKVFAEYEEVLKRKKSLKDFGMGVEDVEHVLSFLAYIGRPFDTHFHFRPNLRDESDNIFVELAVASGAQFVITNNVRDFTHHSQLRFPDFLVATPSSFVKGWRKRNEK